MLERRLKVSLAAKPETQRPGSPRQIRRSAEQIRLPSPRAVDGSVTGRLERPETALWTAGWLREGADSIPGLDASAKSPGTAGKRYRPPRSHTKQSTAKLQA